MPGPNASLSDIQVGLPILPNPGSPTHLSVLSAWVQNCDQTHSCLPKDDTFLPTRVIDVGNGSSPVVKLKCSPRGQTKPGKYLALSHRWGLPEQHQKFCTYTINLEEFTEQIIIDHLPKTFRDAISITRSLGVRYLWIDSLCIIQDDPLDWKSESKLMEHVYSSAYITIAASCASGTDDGFLKPRPERQRVALRTDTGERYYACESIDDFGGDVEQGELNKRGWVLQERALSRRTIYFTERQSYWECGGGVRCETLTKMNNRKAAFLGDANFPHAVEFNVKGMQIQLFQDLYANYSKLALSSEGDRPIAIKGLETRLIHTFKTIGGYGVFERYFHRCILWRRSSEPLKRITSFRGGRVPSWSWMAHNGEIQYLHVPFGETSWALDINFPFNIQNYHYTIVTADWSMPLEIEAKARDIVGPQRRDWFLDEPDRAFSEPFKCVIVGRSKNEPGVCYVMIVCRVSGVEDGDVYERVGVAAMEEDQIAINGQITKCRIQ